jgi:hypothetical protein
MTVRVLVLVLQAAMVRPWVWQQQTVAVQQLSQ